jgi:hypothetical protein
VSVTEASAIPTKLATRSTFARKGADLVGDDDQHADHLTAATQRRTEQRPGEQIGTQCRRHTLIAAHVVGMEQLVAGDGEP